MSNSDKMEKYITYYKIFKVVIALFKAKKQGKTIEDFIEIVKDSEIKIN